VEVTDLHTRRADRVRRGRLRPAELAEGAAKVLSGNDTGTMVTAAPRLYPHMWSWDAAFISIGLAHLNVDRACRELETLLGAQWRNGMLPHIVFGPGDGYFPGPDRWGCAELTSDAPASPRTSGICQPPVHAIALRRVVEIGRRGSVSDATRVQRLLLNCWPRLYRWHSWLARHRDPDESGLISVVHGWESGMDNSPRWDGPYAAVRPGSSLPAYERLDRRLVASSAERPSDEEYDRYLWLVEEMRGVRYHPDEVVRTSSFLVGDVFVSALFALACAELASLGEDYGAPADQVGSLWRWATRSRAAVVSACDPVSGLARDFDQRADSWLSSPTIAGFAPLLCGGLDGAAERSLLATFEGPAWAGYPGLLAAVPPSVSPADPGFRARTYWRGPIWPVVTWLFGWALQRRGLLEPALRLRTEGLRLVVDGSFAEYYHPFSGEPLGSHRQSWTAAVVLDWLPAS
jgi:glucosylglycerate hydrolase